MPGVLEMEEESASLLREVNNPPKSTFAKPQTKASKRSTTLIMLASGVALLLLFFTTRSGGGGSTGDNTEAGVLEKNLQGHMEEKHTQKDDSNVDAAVDDSSSSSTSSTRTDSKKPSSSSAVTEIEHDDGQAFVYSKMATVPPDPYQKTLSMQESLGKWGFWDGDETMRPDYDYTADYPHHDIPGEKFPDDAWQVDAVFVNHLLNDADKLVMRAKEALLMEYGHGKEGLQTEQLRERLAMYHWDTVELDHDDAVPPPAFAKRGARGNGGWTTVRAKEGLVTRLLHAAMTNQPFVVVMGGHSAAAGHGNHFAQSYMMQMHKVLAPVLGRLGVKLITRNMAQGGLGTLHNALGMKNIYGDDIDLLLWDSGMTERETAHLELFARQAILSGNKVPVLWGGHFSLLQQLHKEVGAEVGEFGNGRDGLPVEEEGKTVPFAARVQSGERYCVTCWIDRPDVDKTKFWSLVDRPGGQVKWHPGWRIHQLQGRVLAFALLDALQTAIQNWSDGTMGGPPLDDDWWHVTDHYKAIREKLLAFEGGKCKDVASVLPERVCTTGMQARTQYTPRHDPENSSIVSIVVPAADGSVPTNTEKQVYTEPDVENPCFQIPEGEVDVLGIISSRRRRTLEESIEQQTPSSSKQNSTLRPRHLAEGIVPGKGWQVNGEPPGFCNGEYGSICGRAPKNTCPMLGHHDARGSLIGNEYSGWLVMELPNVSAGLIMLKLFTWLEPSLQTKTEGWKKVNKEGPELEERPEAKALKSLSDLPDSFRFEYAIDGKITSLDKEEFKERRTQPQRVMEIVTLLDDPNFGAKDSVQIGMRMTGCGRTCMFGLTHVYWA